MQSSRMATYTYRSHLPNFHGELFKFITPFGNAWSTLSCTYCNLPLLGLVTLVWNSYGGPEPNSSSVLLISSAEISWCPNAERADIESLFLVAELCDMAQSTWTLPGGALPDGTQQWTVCSGSNKSKMNCFYHSFTSHRKNCFLSNIGWRVQTFRLLLTELVFALYYILN